MDEGSVLETDDELVRAALRRRRCFIYSHVQLTCLAFLHYPRTLSILFLIYSKRLRALSLPA